MSFRRRFPVATLDSVARSGLLLEKFLDRFRSLCHVSDIIKIDGEARFTDIYKLFQIVVQAGKIVLPALIVRDELLFALQQFLPLLFQRFPLHPLMLYTRKHQCVLVIVRVLWELCKELVDGDHGQVLVLVAMKFAVSPGRCTRVLEVRGLTNS